MQADLAVALSFQSGIDGSQSEGWNSSIVGFKVDPYDERLVIIGHNDCEQIPQSFTVDPAGLIIYVVGQVVGKIGDYQIIRSLEN